MLPRNVGPGHDGEQHTWITRAQSWIQITYKIIIAIDNIALIIYNYKLYYNTIRRNTAPNGTWGTILLW